MESGRRAAFGPDFQPCLLWRSRSLQRACAAAVPAQNCRKRKEDQEQIQLKRAGIGAAEPAQTPLQVGELLRSSGQPLDAETRAFMEPRFGHDFSNVRVHTDPTAQTSAQALGADAFTHRNHIAFAAGRFSARHGERQASDCA